MATPATAARPPGRREAAPGSARGLGASRGRWFRSPRSVPGFSLMLLFCSSGTRLVLLPREALLGQKKKIP